MRSVRVVQNFEYVDEIYQTFKLASKGDLKDATLKLKEMCPPPMHTMLFKQPKDEAQKKRLDRSQMIIQDVPPTMSVAQYTEQLKKKQKTKNALHCKSCGNPMKGHKKITECPKNK